MLRHDSRVVFSGSKFTAHSSILGESGQCPSHFLGLRTVGMGMMCSREGTELGSGDLTLGPNDAVTRHFLIYEMVGTR